MATTKYLFQRGHQPILQWGRMPPRERRAADNVSLGALGASDRLHEIQHQRPVTRHEMWHQVGGIGHYENTTIIPGGPEPIQGIVTDISSSMGSFAIGILIGALGYHVIKGV